ncbi:MAG: polysaccharide deacetylase family protein [Defluviitaleaceae bacterium]|nr:polysaccharide deacetylase family protein [Defluviitaleaceae bacterium]
MSKIAFTKNDNRWRVLKLLAVLVLAIAVITASIIAIYGLAGSGGAPDHYIPPAPIVPTPTPAPTPTPTPVSTPEPTPEPTPTITNRIIIDGDEIDAKSYGDLLPLSPILEQIQEAYPVDDDDKMVSLYYLAENLGLGVGYINNTFILSTTPATRIPILVYHHILPDELNTHFSTNAWTISTENFARQMSYLRDNGFYTPTIDELEAFLFQGRPLPQNSVIIHFDDGYYSNYVYAVPILRYYGFRAVLFPITGDAEALGDIQPPLDYTALTRAAASTLFTDLDVFETASHSHALHNRVPDGTETMLVAAAGEDIVLDTLRSFEFVTNHRAYAYPLGMFNDTVIEALGMAGITMGFTVIPGYVTAASDPFRLGRFTVYRETSMERFGNIVNGRG